MDQFLLEFLNQRVTSPLLDVTMTFVSIYGLLALPLFGMILSYNPFSKNTKRLGVSILLALTAGIALTFIFYYLALRPRPSTVRLILAQPNLPSFPSGHTVLACATATLLLLFGWQRMVDEDDNVSVNNGTPDGRGTIVWKIVGAFSGLLALLIMISRVYLGHHYPTDVIAGAALGAATGASTFGLLLSNETGIRRFRWLLWLQVAVVILATMMAYLNLLPRYLLNWPYSDKVLHFLLFGAIAFWLYLWMPTVGLKIGRWFLPLAILLPITLAFIEELLQSTSSLRTASGVDLAFDLAGMICFTLFAHWLLQRDDLARQESSPLASAAADPVE